MAFDTLGVKEVSLRINGHQEPSENILIDFDHNNVARAYQCQMSFNGKELNLGTDLQILQKDFTTLYPIYYFSLEHMDLTRQSVVDMHFKARIGVLPAGNRFRAIAVILFNKAMILEGVGGQMRVIDAPIENV